MNDHDAAAILAAILANWPNPEMPDFAADVYLDELIGLDANAAMRAVRDMVRTHKFRPTPAEISATAGNTPAAQRAFDQYMALMSQPYPGDMDPAVRTVMGDLGGWVYCHAQPIEFHQRFLVAWRRRYGDTDPLTQPVAAIGPAPAPAAEQPVETDPLERKRQAKAYVGTARAALRSATRRHPANPQEHPPA